MMLILIPSCHQLFKNSTLYYYYYLYNLMCQAIIWPFLGFIITICNY